MAGEALLVRGTEKLKELEWSMCHGTGRKISRSKAKNMAFNPLEVIDKICVPNYNYETVFNKSEAPHCYRTIEEILPKINDYISIIGKLTPRCHTK